MSKRFVEAKDLYFVIKVEGLDLGIVLESAVIDKFTKSVCLIVCLRETLLRVDCASNQ